MNNKENLVEKSEMLLDFYKPDMKMEIAELGSKILGMCQGKSFKEVSERLGVGLSPSQVIEKLNIIRDVTDEKETDELLFDVVESLLS